MNHGYSYHICNMEATDEYDFDEDYGIYLTF